MAALKSFKAFVKTNVVLPMETTPFPRKKKELKEKFHEPTKKSQLNSDLKGIGKQWSDKAGKTQGDLHDRLVNHYAFDEDDEHHIKVFTDYSADINQHLIKKNKPKPEKSKDTTKKDPGALEIEKQYAENAERHIKGLDAMLGQHVSPSADFHVYTGLKRSPAELHKETTGQEHDGKSDFQAVFHHFASTSINPRVAKEFARSSVARRNIQGDGRKEAHIIKLKIPAKSKHGAYIADHSEYPEEQEFILKRDRKMKISAEPEKHEYILDKKNPSKKHTLFIWHAELQG